MTGATAAGGNNAKNVSGFNGNLSFTPTFSNSWLVWSLWDNGGSTAFSSLTNNTLQDNFSTTHGERLADGYFTGTVTGGTGVTVGATSGNGSTGVVGVAYEIKASGGTTPAIDASTPATVSATSSGTTLVTASFTPPAGSVVVAVIESNNSSSSVAISDSSSMTWTRRDTSASGVIGIFTATVASGGAANVNLTTPNLALAAPALTPGASGNVNLTTPNLALAAPAVTPSAGSSGNVNLTTPNLSLTAPALSPAGGGNVNLTTPNLALAAPALSPSAETLAFINTWTDWDIDNYGLEVVPVANTTGNGLVAFIGWNPAFGINPVSYVADDAHNWWVPLVTSSVNGDVRCSIWYAPNARAANYVSISTSQWTGGIAAVVCEVTGAPIWSQLDGTPQVAFNNSTTSQSLSATASGADLALGIAVVGNVTETPSSTGSGWTSLASAQALQSFGSGTTTIQPVWKSVTGSGSVSESWTVGSAAPMASAMALLNLSPSAPAQPNANWPGIKVEIAFGYSPGDPTSVMQWTDVSSYARQPDGSTIFDSTRGRSYELATPEAGTLTVWLDNSSGNFTPGNSASPYFPNVKLQTPIRISGKWENNIYPIAFGYISGWPQQWPDPQYGFAPVTAVDAMGVLASVGMYSAYSSEVVFDQPYAYFPFGEYYDEPGGLPFNNLAWGNSRPAYGVNDIVRDSPLETGLTLGLFGDSGTGIGVSGLTGSTYASAGAIYEDPNLPQVSANGLTIEFVASITGSTSSGAEWYLFQAYGSPPNYLPPGLASNSPLPSIYIRAIYVTSTTVDLQLWLTDFNANIFTATISATIPADGIPHHHCLTLTGTSSYAFNYYFDGALLNSGTSTLVSVASDIRSLAWGPAVTFTSGGASVFAQNYTLAHGAIYGYALDAARIAKHANTANNGSFGDSSMRRFTKVLAWGRAGVPKAAGPASASPLMGYADNMAQRDIADVLGDITTSEQGMVYADAAGNVWYRSRQQGYNQTPKFVFGDNPALGEIPYSVSQSFAFDNTYLYNQAAVQRVISQTQTPIIDASGVYPTTSTQYGADIVERDAASETEYLPRNALSVTVETTSDEDAFDWGNWNLQKYKEPSYRVMNLILAPASNPNIWSTALLVEQGDIVQVNRRPVGSPAYSVLGMVQQVEVTGGPSAYQVNITISPYNIEQNVLQVGVSGYDSVTTNRLAW